MWAMCSSPWLLIGPLTGDTIAQTLDQGLKCARRGPQLRAACVIDESEPTEHPVILCACNRSVFWDLKSITGR